MDLGALIEEITRLVCERLEGAAVAEPADATVASSPAPAAARRLLVVLGEGSPAPQGGFNVEEFVPHLGDLLKKNGPVVCEVCPSSRFLCQDLGSQLSGCDVRVLDGTPDWEGHGRTCDVLLVPNLSVALLAKLALLIADEPAVAAALQFLIQGKPVVAACDDIQFLLAHEGKIPRGVLDVVRGHLRAVQALGVRLCASREVASQVGCALGTDVPPTSRGRAVVTKEDVDDLGRQGKTAATYPAGTIVTALAWEAAARLGITLAVGG